VKQGWPRAFTLPLATLPIGLFVAWRVIVEPPSRGHNRLLAMSGGAVAGVRGADVLGNRQGKGCDAVSGLIILVLLLELVLDHDGCLRSNGSSH
jgi:hypothetical protein